MFDGFKWTFIIFSEYRTHQYSKNSLSTGRSYKCVFFLTDLNICVKFLAYDICSFFSVTFNVMSGIVYKYSLWFLIFLVCSFGIFMYRNIVARFFARKPTVKFSSLFYGWLSLCDITFLDPYFIRSIIFYLLFGRNWRYKVQINNKRYKFLFCFSKIFEVII